HFSDAGRFMVPLRFILESMGATVDWIQETKTVVVHRGDTIIEMKQGWRDVTVNGQVMTMDTEVTAVGGRTVVPLRFLTDWLGGSLDWDQTTLTATLHLPQ
ncbi:MAG: copper amine oxidase N-terminal domain-containing protein, partial [Bacillota bacterium]